MKKNIGHASTNQGIPVSVSMGDVLEAEGIEKKQSPNIRRMLYICFLAVFNALVVGVVAKLMVQVIALVTGISFFGVIDTENISPVGNHLGLWVIFIPVIGGIIVGFMARYGSKDIRGHGIPEAMEGVLGHKSKIPPIVTLLKPLSAAIAIGTGCPFGAEGPIIAAGGACGSLFGQIVKTSDYERKVLLTSGASAGMAAIFGSPVAAIMLAIELLLFEFSPRSIIPVALASITGAAAHIFFFGYRPMFAMSFVPSPDIVQLIVYTVIGAVVGICSVGVTKSLYAVEDMFKKIPVHWMWWPAIGAIAVGIIGFFAPATMGVGYENISGILGGNLAVKALLIFCFLKFISWAVSLASGNSGGTLAPLFTIGGAAGALIAVGINWLFPELGLSVAMAGLIGMAAMFSGATRAFLTSVIFALETTQQSNLLLPLLGGCAAAYFISYVMMRDTIMTEKITRHGINAPDSYVPDVLNTFMVKDVLKGEVDVLSANDTIAQARTFINEPGGKNFKLAFAVVDEQADNKLAGTISAQEIFSSQYTGGEILNTLVKGHPITIYEDDTLHTAIDKMTTYNVVILPVVSRKNREHLLGVLSYRGIMEAYEIRKRESEEETITISVMERGMDIFVRGRKFMGRK